MVARGEEVISSILELTDGMEEIPSSHLVPSELRPTTKLDDWGPIPVIDMSLKDRNVLKKLVGDAARDWGVFQVINHNVSIPELLSVGEEVKLFFHRPCENKVKLELEPLKILDTEVYYTGDNTKEDLHSLYWAESLVCLWKSWSKITEKVTRSSDLIFPGGNEAFRSGTNEIVMGCRILTVEVLHLLAEYLGLEAGFFSDHCFPEGSSLFRWNYYPSCPRPNETLGAIAHTDPNLLTVLYQDEAGGLQVKKNDVWYGVQPMTEALIINIGDCLHIFSNAIFHSVVHQVLVNEKAHRLSLAAIYYLEQQTDMTAPDSLVTEKRPRMFKSLSAHDYWTMIFNERREHKFPKSLNGLEALRDFIRRPQEQTA
ncbi:protein MpDOXC36 [Marchantia polymorpha subsp. ruderalis]|nr:hypothetical protein MARPO_0111s0001 [Marchantia polymorpha]BBN17682.1 hypothetical protein Mp_7g16190 [Marchantia polymorpha subsp. ruderalis]|eukprot:PTQ31422.1 hypothetical protein MARPO_0111s0001 [Marchantia polymorpha]